MKVYQNGKNLRIVVSGLAAFESACYRRSLSVPAADAEHLCHDSRVQIAGMSPYRKAVTYGIVDRTTFRTPAGTFVQLVLGEPA